MPELIDLRSDTVTRPTDAVRRVMAEAHLVRLDDVPAPVVAEAAKAQGVLVSQTSASGLRLATNLGVDRAGIERAADVLALLLGR